MRIILALLFFGLLGCAPTRQQLQERINELDTENVRLRSQLAVCQNTMKDTADRLRKFQGILGHSMKLHEEAEKRSASGKGK